MSFSGYDTALEMRRLIENVAAGVVNKLRPRPRYGSVRSIDDENAKCTVLFVGDTEPVEVNTGSLVPSHIGQRVKVEGLGVDKCVTALYGNEGITVHAASTGPFVKLARIFTGIRKEVTLDASTADQLKVQFASGGANTNAWVFKSDGTAYYNTDIEANQVQIGPPVISGGIQNTELSFFSAYTSASFDISSNVFTTVQAIDTVESNTGGGLFDNAGRYTVPFTGIYIIQAFARLPDSSTERNAGIGVHTASTDFGEFQWGPFGGTQRNRIGYSRIAWVTKGQVLRLFMYSSGVSTTGITAGMTITGIPDTIVYALTNVPDENNMVKINGTLYQRTGTFSTTWTAASWNWSNATAGTYVATWSLPRPYAPPSGYGFECFLVASSRFAFLSTTDMASVNTNCAGRFVQFGNETASATTIGWRLTKIG